MFSATEAETETETERAMDPLSVLRDYAMRSDLDSIKRVGEEYHFGDEYRFPCSVETAYRSKQGNLYTLDSLVFFVKNTQVKHTEYMQQSRALKLQTVTFIDRKALLDYLEGRIQSADAIELLAPSSAAVSSAPLHMDQGFPATEEDGSSAGVLSIGGAAWVTAGMLLWEDARCFET